VPLFLRVSRPDIVRTTVRFVRCPLKCADGADFSRRETVRTTVRIVRSGPRPGRRDIARRPHSDPHSRRTAAQMGTNGPHNRMVAHLVLIVHDRTVIAQSHGATRAVHLAGAVAFLIGIVRSSGDRSRTRNEEGPPPSGHFRTLVAAVTTPVRRYIDFERAFQEGAVRT
jgi:hypothetical protein